MRWRWALFVVPFLGVGLLPKWLVPAVGDRIARALRRVALVSAPAPEASATDAPVAADAMPEAHDSGDASLVDAGSARRRRVQAGATGRRTPASHLSIDAAQAARVLSHGWKGVRGANAVDANGRGVGVRLSGVGALGVGLADGDVITSVDGTPTPDIDSAAAAGTHALAANEPVVRATLLRNGEIIDVTAEVPPRTAPDAPPEGVP